MGSPGAEVPDVIPEWYPNTLMGSPPVRGIPAMTRRASPWVVGLALIAGGCSGRSLPYQGKSVADLQNMIDSDDPSAQVQGALGLSLHGPEARPAVPALTRLLSSPRGAVRQEAAVALEKIGPDAAEAVAALTAALRDPEWIVRRQAALALGGIGAASRSSLPELDRLGRDPSERVRQAAKDAALKINAAGSDQEKNSAKSS